MFVHTEPLEIAVTFWPSFFMIGRSN